MKRKTIAVLCHYFSISQKSGYSVASELYTALSEKYDIKILVPMTENIYYDDVTVINPHMKIQKILPASDFNLESNNYNNQWKFYFKAHEDKVFSENLKNATEEASLIISDSVHFFRLIKKILPDKKIILRSLDVEYDKIHKSDTINVNDELESLIFNFEKEAYDSADLILTLSQDDEQRLCELYNLDMSRTKRLPLCVLNISRYKNFIPESRQKREKTNCFFIGYANRYVMETAKRIIEIAEELTDVLFHLVGKVGIALVDCSLPQNVIIHGIVDDKNKIEIMSKCDFAINVTSQTSGVAVKTLEYFSYGIPVLSNNRGVRGFDVQPNIEYFPAGHETLANDIAKFLKSDENQRYDMALRAFKYVLENNDYEKYMNIFDDIINAGDIDLKETSAYIFGAGAVGRQAFNELKKQGYNFLGFADNDAQRHGTECSGLQIISSEKVFLEIKSNLSKKIIIAVNKFEYLAEMYAQAKKEISDDNILIYWKGVLDNNEIDRNKLLIHQSK